MSIFFKLERKIALIFSDLENLWKNYSYIPEIYQKKSHLFLSYFGMPFLQDFVTKLMLHQSKLHPPGKIRTGCFRWSKLQVYSVKRRGTMETESGFRHLWSLGVFKDNWNGENWDITDRGFLLLRLKVLGCSLKYMLISADILVYDRL